MKYHSFKYVKILLVLIVSLHALTVSAQQFRKPLSSPRDQYESSNAKWNVGLVGGANLTTWLHFQSKQSSNWFLQNYKTFDSISPFTASLGYFGGIGVERMLKSNLSVGLNVVYAQHNVKLGYVDNRFPYAWNPGTQRILYGQIVKNFTAKYSTLDAYIPITYYISLASSKNIMPYVYIAPRISFVLPLDTLNQMTYSTSYTDSIGKPLPNYDNRTETVPFNSSTYRKLNVGGTVGVGTLFRINVSNYYFLIKFDVSANMNAITTFKKGQIINNDFNHLRYSADAYATMTLLLPIKKQLQDACIRWGKYN